MEEGGYSLDDVASRSAARSGGIGIDRSLLGWRGAGEAWGGSEPAVASIGLTEGKGGRTRGLGQRHEAGREMEILKV